MASDVYVITKTILDKNKKLRYQELTQEEIDFMEEFEENDLKNFPKNPSNEENIRKNKYDRLVYQKTTNEESLEDVRKNLRQALNVKQTIENEYNKISKISRFFSYFLRNSWTKAGRIRNELKDCEQAFNDCGWTSEEADNALNSQALKVIDDDYFIKFKSASLENKFNSKRKIKDLTEKTKIGGFIEVPEMDDDDELSTEQEKITVIEGSNLNKQSSDYIQEENNENIISNVKEEEHNL